MSTNRYQITHPRTATVTVETMQAAANYLYPFVNSPDFEQYRITDTTNGKVHRPYVDTCMFSLMIVEVKQ